MKTAIFDTFGNPADVLRCVEGPDEPAPTGTNVVIRMLRMPINPADLMNVTGTYGAAPPALPAFPGTEGVGEIIAIGPDVRGMTIGDRVAPLVGPTWRSHLTRDQSKVILVPEALGTHQAAMMKANPATAIQLLTTIVPLKAGDWAIQNAANSAVGVLTCAYAKRHGIHTVNIVRCPDAEANVIAAGGDVTVIDHGQTLADLSEEIRDRTNGAMIKLGIDAIAGEASERMATSLGEGGVLVNYGRLSNQPLHVSANHLIFRGISVRGFWLANWFKQASADDIHNLYKTKIVPLFLDGTFRVDVVAEYPLEDVTTAARHAASAGNNGKIMLIG